MMRPAAILLLLSALAAGAWAQRSSEPSNVPEHEDFYRVYGYETPLQGWLEPNYWTTWVPRSSGSYDHFQRSLGREGLMAHSLELEYGVSDHFALASYLDFEDPHGTGPMLTQGHVEARYRFAQAYDHWINSAVYAEYYLPRKAYNDSESIEFRGIFEKDLQDLRVDVNPVLDVSTTGSERGDAPQLGLDVGLYYRRFSLWNRRSSTTPRLARSTIFLQRAVSSSSSFPPHRFSFTAIGCGMSGLVSASAMPATTLR